jgi:predicted nucleic acid-binding protein
VIYLLDVNMLIAAIWRDHQDQPRVEAWLHGKQTATCPISELGFLRISSGDTFPLRAEPEPCRNALSEFVQKHRCRFIPDDFSPRRVAAQSSRQFTDLYLAELAEKNRMKLATLDRRISHRAVVVIS